MIIDITTLDNGIIDFGFQMPKTFFQDDSDLFDLSGPVTTIIHLEKSGERIFINGKFDARIHVNCSRCLELFDYFMKTNFICEFQPYSKWTSKSDKIELSAEELDIVWYNNNKIDLTEQVRQNIILSIPMQPLCSIQCKGLCYQCGENLNITTCQCVQSVQKDNAHPFHDLSKFKLS